MRHFILYLLLACIIPAIAQPGKDGPLTVNSTNQILNHYIPVSVDIAVGSNTVAMANSSLFSVCPGDLVMIYQAQGANMDITNTSSYGNITSYNSAGFYEFKYVQSINGNTITTQTTFTNSYAIAGRVQLIKVPQYTTLTINSGASIIPKPWKDTTIASVAYRFGGLVVLHSTNIINNGTITASDCGFRGGAFTNDIGINLGATAFRSTLSTQGGEKGESIFGYQLDYDVNANGRYCMGAPANGGGGGNNHNSGGGGGGNGYNGNTWSGQGVMIVNVNNPIAGWALTTAYISNGNSITNSSGGGRGGYTYGDANGNALIDPPGSSAWIGDTRREVGGVGGRPLTNINPEGRIYFGGGGGAPHANNYSSGPGTNGGGIVYLIATTGITGIGMILSNVQAATNASICSCDAAPGGGAGGSIVIKTGAISSSQNVTANGGNGGNQFTLNPPGSYYESEGPGAGGGGGFVAISAGAITPQINGGLNGTTVSNSLTEMICNGATQGATGQTLPVTTNFVSFIPLTNSSVSASNNGPLCAGSPLILTTTVSALSYTWTGPNASSSSSQSYTITNPVISASGIYSVQFSFGNCLLPATATTQVIINPLPTVTITGALSFCTGQTLILNSSVSSATAYAWSGPNGFSATTQNITIPNSATNMAGVYNLVITNSGGCIATALANVSITPTPTITLLHNAPVCVGASLNFTVTGTANYTLTGPNGFSSTLSNPSITNITSAAAGIYSLTANNANCPASVTTSVSVNPLPIPTIINNAAPVICAGQSISLNGGGGSSYQWSGPAAFTSSLQNMSITPASIANSGSYTLTVFSIAGCSASIVSLAITVNSTPAVSVNGASVCIGQTVSLNANSSANSFLWNGPNSFTSSAQTINFSNAALNLSGNYNVLVTSTQGCTNTAVSNVSVYPLPTPSLSSNSPVCAGSTLNLSGSGGISYLYAGPDGFSSTLQNPSINNVSYAASGNYTLTASNPGCSAAVTLPVSIFGSGSGTLSANNNDLCVPFCSVFSLNATNVSASNTTISINGQLFSGNNINYCISTAGNYTVNSVFKDNDGCVNSSTLLVTAYAPPIADFEFSPTKPVENIDNVLFTNTSTGPAQTNWNWFFINNDSYTSANQNTFYLFETAGAYPVAMIVKNQWGCSDTVTKIITVGEDFSFYIPNSFTPNGDGLNDIFEPKGHGIKNYSMQIFDRWGEKIFSSKDFSIGWDGTFKGKKCEVDAYTWKIDLSDPQGKARTFTGHVNIVE